MRATYTLQFTDGTSDNLIIAGNEAVLEKNSKFQWYQGAGTPWAALAIGICAVHNSYKTIKNVSGGNLDLLKDAFDHSERCRYSILRDGRPFNIWATKTNRQGPLIADDIDLEGIRGEEFYDQ